MKYPVGLFVGRFQPFHNGHVWEVEEAFGRVERLIIGIGSSNIVDEQNPWDESQRRAMIERVIKERGWGEKILAILAFPDTTDQLWVKNVVRGVEGLGYAKAECLVLGNNDWVNDLLAKELFPIHEPGFFERDKYEGTKIRRMMKAGGKEWAHLVPKSVEKIIESFG